MGINSADIGKNRGDAEWPVEDGEQWDDKRIWIMLKEKVRSAHFSGGGRFVCKCHGKLRCQ